MSKRTPVNILLNTDVLSNIFGKIAKKSEKGPVNKNEAVNIAAAEILGQNQNWGALLHKVGLVTALGVKEPEKEPEDDRPKSSIKCYPGGRLSLSYEDDIIHCGMDVWPSQEDIDELRFLIGERRHGHPGVVTIDNLTICVTGNEIAGVGIESAYQDSFPNLQEEDIVRAIVDFERLS